MAASSIDIFNLGLAPATLIDFDQIGAERAC
jgi:hypothetical protein